MRFKEYLLNEQTNYFADKVGSILSAVTDLDSESKNISARELMAFAKQIVKRIRPILQSSWSQDKTTSLKNLQKCAVAIMKCIEEKGDLPSTISAVKSQLEKISGDLGQPITKLSPTEAEGKSNKDNATTAGTESKPEAAPPPAASAPPEQPQTVDQTPQAGQPVPPGQDMAAPPLGGSTGQLDAV